MRAEGEDFFSPRASGARSAAWLLIYCVFDAFYMIFLQLRLRGRGYAVCHVSVAMGWAIMVVPAFVSLTYFDANIFVLWSFICIYIMLMGILFISAFAGRWKHMRVIEEKMEELPSVFALCLDKRAVNYESARIEKERNPAAKVGLDRNGQSIR